MWDRRGGLQPSTTKPQLGALDCHVAALLAMTEWCMELRLACVDVVMEMWTICAEDVLFDDGEVVRCDNLPTMGVLP